MDFNRWQLRLVRHQAAPRRDLHREEVCGSQHLPMQLEELRPTHPGLAPLGSRFHMVAAQDVTHGDRIDGMPQVGQRALDPSIAPGRILFCHLDGEPLDVLCHWWPPQRCAARAPVELLRDEAVIPAQEGVRGGDRGDAFEALAPERVGQSGEAAALGIGESEPTATEVGFEDTVFLDQIGDHLLLVTLDPPGDHHDEHLQNHGLPLGWRQ